MATVEDKNRNVEDVQEESGDSDSDFGPEDHVFFVQQPRDGDSNSDFDDDEDDDDHDHDDEDHVSGPSTSAESKLVSPT